MGALDILILKITEKLNITCRKVGDIESERLGFGKLSGIMDQGSKEYSP